MDREGPGVEISPDHVLQQKGAEAQHAARVDVPDFNISTRGDFEPLVTERVFFRVQAILDGRYEVTGPRQRADPDFPLRGYVRCQTCGKPLTASWSKGRSDYYAYYHCRGRCRAVNVTKTHLEQLFVDEIRFDGKRLVGTGTTLPVFSYLNPVSEAGEDLVDLTGIEPVTS